MSFPEYLDCALHITRYDQAELFFRDAKYSGRPRLTSTLRQKLREAELNPTQYGKLLFKAIFHGSERDRLLQGYRESLKIALSSDKGLRLRIHVPENASDELHALHWEFLFDPTDHKALGSWVSTPISRFLSVVHPAQKRELATRPRILCVLSTPIDIARYQLPDIDRKFLQRSIKGSLEPLRSRLSYEILDGPATPGRIRDHLVQGDFDAVHVQAHCILATDRETTTKARVALEGSDRQADFVDEDDFSWIFEVYNKPGLITLVACQSGTQSGKNPFAGLGLRLVEQGVSAVVAMRRAISFEAAELFNTHFYRNMNRCGQVDAAANEARSQLYYNNKDELDWTAPAVFMNIRDGQLWTAEPGTGAYPTRQRSDKFEDDGEFDWDTVMRQFRDNPCVPILGPGIYKDLLPSPDDIARRWAKQHDYPMTDRLSLPYVAQFMHAYDQGSPHAELPRVLREYLLDTKGTTAHHSLRGRTLTEVITALSDKIFDDDPDEPHRILAEMNMNTVVTTNHDSLMASAFEWAKKTPLRIACPWAKPPEDLKSSDDYKYLRGTRETPLVFHLFGCDQEHRTQVLTEDDHLDFLSNVAASYDHKIPVDLNADLADSMLMFLGYDVSSLDCRVLFRGLVAHLKRPRHLRMRIATFQLDHAKHDKKQLGRLKKFIKSDCGNLNIQTFWGTARQFLTEFRRHWKNWKNNA